MAKCTYIERDLRIQRVAELIVKGASRGDILRFTAEMFSLSERQTNTYIAKARERIQEDWKIDRQALIAEHLSRMNLVVKHAFRTEDYKAVVSASRYQAELTQCLK